MRGQEGSTPSFSRRWRAPGFTVFVFIVIKYQKMQTAVGVTVHSVWGYVRSAVVTV